MKILRLAAVFLAPLSMLVLGYLFLMPPIRPDPDHRVYCRRNPGPCLPIDHRRFSRCHTDAGGTARNRHVWDYSARRFFIDAGNPLRNSKR